MNIPNAFLGRKDRPTGREVLSVLGDSADIWEEFVAWLAAKGVNGQQWKSSSPKYGWSLRLSVKKRNIVYLSPCEGCFQVSFALGDRAVAAALASDLPKNIIDEIRGARRYAEGTGVRLLVKRPDDVPAIRKLALIKLAN